MLDEPPYYPLNSSSAQLQQQELQLRQYTLAVISARERDRERARLSPEPRLEIMRPVSPFQNKRPLAHQQLQTTPQIQTQAQAQREQRIWNPPHSTSQPYTHAKSSHAQEASQANASMIFNSHSGSRTGHSGSRPRPRVRTGEPCRARAAQRDADISPALQMMNYDTSFTTSSSDQAHSQAATHTPDPAGTLTLPERSDANRSTSPEGGRKKNPGWRKPVPKYIPTPPSTPPPTTFERLPSTREKEEQVPPVPRPAKLSTNVQSSRPHVSTVKVHTELSSPSLNQAPPSRPARTAMDPQVPVMFRDLTASRTRIAAIQQPTRAQTRSDVLSRTPMTMTTGTQNVTHAHPLLSTQTPAVPQTQMSSAPRALPQAHTKYHDGTLQSDVSTQPNAAKALYPDDRTEVRTVLMHPQPRKVPSMSQLVAMVLPSRTPSRTPPRTPSPRIPLTGKEISGPLPLLSVPAAKPATTQAAVPSLSLYPPSPIAHTEAASTTYKPLSDVLLQPERIQLPPSGSSSARSSPHASPRKPAVPLQTPHSVSPRASPCRTTSALPVSSLSESPRASPHRATAPLPTRSRSRSPTAITQQAPARPPSPSPLSNVSITAPKSGLPSHHLSGSELTEKAEATVQVAHMVTTHAVSKSPEGRTFSSARRADANARENSCPSVGQLPQDTKVASTSQGEPVVVQDCKLPSQGSGGMQAQGSKEKGVSWTIRRSPEPIREDRQSPQLLCSDSAILVADAPAKEQTMRDHGQLLRDFTRKVAQKENIKDTSSENAAVAVPPCEQAWNSWDVRPDTATLLEQEVTPEGKNRHSSDPPQDCTGKHPESFARTTRVLPSADKHPAPIPMSDRVEVSRESGLATPPITPPGSLESKESDKLDSLKKGEDNIVRRPSEEDAGSIAHPITPAHLPACDGSGKDIVRREAIIQDERLPVADELSVEPEARVTGRPTPPAPMLELPAVTTSVLRMEPPEPPLPSGWKETITRVVRSNVDPSSNPTPLFSSRVEADADSDPFQSLRPTGYPQSQPTKLVDSVLTTRYVTCEAPRNQAELETTALEHNVREMETRHMFEMSQASEKGAVVTERDLHLLSSKSPRQKPAKLERPPDATLSVDHSPALGSSPLSSTANLTLSEVTVRSYSPVLRNKTLQRYNVVTSATQERTDVPPSVTAEEEHMSSLTTLFPPAQQPAELTSPSHSSGSKRTREKSARIRTDGSDRVTRAVPVEERLLEDGIRHRNVAVSAVNEPSSESQSSVNPVSPPRYQSLGTSKQFPPNASESNLAQPRGKDVARHSPSSPLVVARPLPSTSQSQAPPRPQRHLHGHHKRLPAPEVTQQTYRPPTPPIPSHYRKKRSNDPLPAEPATFMKPAVHVIYPDTSTSYGPSLSGDTAFNMPGSRPSNNTELSTARREDRIRPQSPSPSISGSREQNEDEDDEPETYPRVPPKVRRPEANVVNNPGSPSNSDRPSDFTIQYATRGQVRYPSAPVGQARAHILMFPPSSNSSKSRTGEQVEGTLLSSEPRSRRTLQPRATKAARSQSEKLLRRNNNVQPVARSRSTPIPSSRQRSRRGFWRLFGLWARAFVARFKTWASPTPSASHSTEYGGYYDAY